MVVIRYVTRARWSEVLEQDLDDRASVTVYEPDPAPEFIGILDAQGNELFRIEERDPIGFRCQSKQR